MWYEVEWAEANSCARTKKEYIEADDLVDALEKAIDETHVDNLADSLHVVRVARPPLMYFRK